MDGEKRKRNGRQSGEVKAAAVSVLEKAKTVLTLFELMQMQGEASTPKYAILTCRIFYTKHGERVERIRARKDGKSMKLFYNPAAYQDAKNIIFNTSLDVESAADLAAVCKHDHILAECENGRRNNENFLSCDVIGMDIDNDFAEDPKAWAEPGRIRADLPGVFFFVATSRNHNKIKNPGRANEKSARPRFHVYFPINRTTNRERVTRIKNALAARFCYYDKAAKDAARLFFGNRETIVKQYDGEILLDDFLLDNILADPGKDTRTEQKTAPAAVQDPEIMRALDYIPPESVDYSTWIEIGMALKAGGYDFSLWDNWSASDPRYKAAEMKSKWASFRGSGVNVGTIIHYAQQNGYEYRGNAQNDPYFDFAGEFEETPAESVKTKIGALQSVAGAKDKKAKSTIEYLETDFASDTEKLKAAENRKTGFSNLDEKSGGLYAGIYVIAAISSLGKTTFALQLADNLARSGESILFYAFEQTRAELVSKSLARILGEKHGKAVPRPKENPPTSIDIRFGRKPAETAAAIKEYRDFVGDRVNIFECDFKWTISDIAESITSYIKDTGRKPIVFIDYLQLIKPRQNYKTKGIRENIDDILQELKLISSALNLTLFVISSVNRSNYLTPIDFEALKESGGIEYTADVIWGLQLEAINLQVFNQQNKLAEKHKIIKNAKARDPREIQLTCLKNRYGRANFECFFNYYPARDYFVPTCGHKYDDAGEILDGIGTENPFDKLPFEAVKIERDANGGIIDKSEILGAAKRDLEIKAEQIKKEREKFLKKQQKYAAWSEAQAERIQGLADEIQAGDLNEIL